MKNCTSSIRCRDSNSRPLEHESPRITTRPWLPPMVLPFTYETKLHHHHHVLLYLPTYLPTYLHTYPSWPMSSVDKSNIQTSGQKYFLWYVMSWQQGRPSRGAFPSLRTGQFCCSANLKFFARLSLNTFSVFSYQRSRQLCLTQNKNGFTVFFQFLKVKIL